MHGGEKGGRTEVNKRDEEDWNRGAIVCPGRVWSINLSPINPPNHCKYALEHLVSQQSVRETS